MNTNVVGAHSDNGPAMKDGVILDDDRVLDHLLLTEDLYLPEYPYFFRSGFDPMTRRTVTKWMQEVCEEENCTGAVYPMAVNYFDRFLCKCDVPKNFLQLIAADCILIASKIRQSSHISADTLCYYSDHSITPCQIRSFELLIALKLQWNLSSVTAYDFVDQLLGRIPRGWYGPQQEETIRNHTVTLIHLCYSENDFFGQKASLIATAAIVSAIRGLKIRMDSSRVKTVCNLTKVSDEKVEKMVSDIEGVVTEEMSKLQTTDRIISSEAAAKGCSTQARATVDIPDHLDF